MPGSSPAEAAQWYVDDVQRAISCVTDSVVTISGGYHPAAQPHVLLLGEGFPVPLKGDPRLSLLILQNYRIIENSRAMSRSERWRVTTSAYEYYVSLFDGPEILAYHWHPEITGSVVTPHLHIGTGSGATFSILINAHLPSGRVSIEALLRLLITEFGVEPTRSDWDAVLAETESRYEELRSW